MHARALMAISLASLAAVSARAQAPAVPLATTPASSAFCLFEVPVEDVTKRRWVNLAHVQYVDATSTGVRLFYGGGNFGAGHEALVPATTPSEIQSVFERLRRTALGCANARSGN